MKNFALVATLFAALVYAAASPARADGYFIPTNDHSSSPDAFDGDISSADLVNLNQPILNSTLDSAFVTSGTISDGSLDGIHDGTGSATGSFTDSLTLEFDLNLEPLTGGSATGYDITQILSIAGAAYQVGSDQYGAAAQIFNVAFSKVSDPNTFETYGNFENTDGIDFTTGMAHDTDSSQATEILLASGNQGPIYSQVGKIIFSYDLTGDSNIPSGNLTTLREIDVIGTPSVPEPSAYALLMMGGIFFLAARFRHRSV